MAAPTAAPAVERQRSLTNLLLAGAIEKAPLSREANYTYLGEFAAATDGADSSAAQPFARRRTAAKESAGLGPDAQARGTGVSSASLGQEAQAAPQQFVPAFEARAKERLDKALAPAAVLAVFRLEQAGRLLRVTDKDGSVYLGSFQPAASPTPPAAGARRAPGASPALAAPADLKAARPAPEAPAIAFRRLLAPAQPYSFQVTGTNRSLNQRVDFTGSLAADTNSAAPSALRVSGKAVIGGAQEVRIEAVERKP